MLASKCQCCAASETIHHVLISNHEVQRVWGWFSQLFQVDIRETDSCLVRFKRWINSSQKVKQGHIRVLLPILIGWSAWNARNDKKFNNIPFTAEIMIQKIITFLVNNHTASPYPASMWDGDLQIASMWKIFFLSPAAKRIVTVLWIKPHVGTIKLNSDGAYHQGNHMSAVGDILRDSDGRILLAYQQFIGVSSVVYAELYGIWKGLTLCQKTHHHEILVKSDSQVALGLIQQHSQLWKWDLINILTRILQLTQHMSVSFKHQYREGNGATDWLASVSLKKKCSRHYCPAEIPIPYRRIAFTDKSSIPYLRKVH